MLEKNDFVNIKNKVSELSLNYLSKEEIDKFNQHILNKLNDFNPTLMIYGTYNAGKSSTLNALFGQEEMAKTGDIPETAEVCPYLYKGYTIFDTPGINAPIEHEEITKEHLKKCEIILFVLSNDGSLEEEFIYEKISEIVKSNKPIIIVLNNKRNTEMGSIEAINEIDKVNVNLSKIGDRNGIEKIENKVKLCMINAKTALKGKIENKQLLLKKSNLLELENMINSLLDNSGSNEVINALKKYIEDFIENVINNIDKNIDSKEVKKIEEIITYIEKLKQHTEVNLKNILHKKMIILKNEIVSIISSGNVNNLQNFIDEYLKDVVEQIYIEIDNVKEKLKSKFDEFSAEIKLINPEYNTNISNSNDPDDSFFPENIKKSIYETANNKDLITSGTQKALTLAKKWLPKKVMYGKGPVWISKAAGRIAVFVQVSKSAYDIYDAQKEMKNQIKLERERILGIENNALSISEQIEASINQNINEVIVEIFDNLLKQYREISKTITQENSQLFEDKRNLQDILRNL
jgi:predicted GTPase